MIPVDLYLRVRQREGRIYSDDVAARLPEIPNGHPLAGEWRLRADSCAKLIRYLSRSSKPHTILEPGCGNGWLSNQLASLPLARVCGLDLNTIELAQASRLFARRNLRFLVADVFRLPFLPGTFDVIVLASIIQYFEDLPRLVQALQPVLSESGEIHLLDSPLYEAGELAAARQRTRHYYHSLGFPEMAGYYHHHPISTLEAFSPRWLYRPNTRLTRLKRRLGQLASPFPWICLRKKSPDAYPLD